MSRDWLVSFITICFEIIKKTTSEQTFYSLPQSSLYTMERLFLVVTFFYVFIYEMQVIFYIFFFDNKKNRTLHKIITFLQSRLVVLEVAKNVLC